MWETESRKPWLGLVAVMAVLSLIATACGPTAEPTEATTQVIEQEARSESAEGEQVGGPTATVTLWHAWQKNETRSLNQVIAAFQGTYPRVRFEVLYVPFDDLRDQFENTAAAGGGPTVLIGAADWGPALYDAGLIADLSAMISRASLRTINPAALGAVNYHNALIGLPHTIKGVVMFRNAAIIPAAPATWDDLVAAAQAATTEDVFGANLERGFFFSAGHLSGIGGLLMDVDGDPLFNDERGVEWVNLLDSFEDAGPVEYYTDDDLKRFEGGRAGLIIDWTQNMSRLAEAFGAENLAIDPWPTPLSGYVQTENIYLSANTEGEDKDAGSAFMEYFLSPEAQALLTEAGHIPAVVGVEVSDPLMAQAVDALAGGATFPVIPEMGAYWGPMDTALQSVFDEGADPAAVLQQAYNSISAAIADMRGGTMPEEPVTGTITLWHPWTESEIPGLNAVIAAFQEKHPDVQFDLLAVPFDNLRGQFENAAAAGGGPTVLVGAADWGPALYDAELVADVTGFTSGPFLASIKEVALSAVRYKGALIGLPHTIKGVVMFRNAAIVPAAPATWDELVTAAQAATQGDVVGANLERGFSFSAGHLSGLGGQLMGRNGDPRFNDERAVEWVNLLNSFEEAGPTEYYTDNDLNLFKAGKAGIIIDGTWNKAGLVEAIGAENLAIDPWPTYGEGGYLSGYVQAENLYLGANAEGDDQTAAWKFIEFCLSPEAQAMLADIGHIPAIAGVEINDPLMLQAVEALEGGTPLPVIPEMGAYWEPMDTALQSVFEQAADPAEALQQAYDTITAAIEKGRGGQ
jgi:arabinogalactan oligomer/maltooligosaccharide transport system substrate-binding protein